MSTIHLIGGEKGGVGKSLVARILAQYLIDHAQPFQAFDSDRSHGALLRFYPQYTLPLPLDEIGGLDRVIETAAAQRNKTVLVDLAAQSYTPLVLWMQDSRVLETAGELTLTLKYWHVMDSGRDSVELLGRLLDEFHGRLPLVLVLNQMRSETFELLESSGQRARAEQLGARVVVLNRLADATMQKIDAANTSFWAAVNHSSSAQGTLGLLERQRLTVWLNRAYEQIDLVGL
ncbi:MAG: mobilization protein [Steroidobacteraceae bacterium]